MKNILCIMATLVGLVALASNNSSAQEIKGAQRLITAPVGTTENVTTTATTTETTSEIVPVKNKEKQQQSFVVDGGHTAIHFSLKSRGFVGPYEIVAHRERGLFGPSTVETYLYDRRDGSLAVVNPSSSPGVGIAIVNGGAVVGASYLFGHSIRPDQATVNNGSSSSANNENSTSSSSSATGGSSTSVSTGGTATSTSTATGGNGIGGNGGNGTGGNGGNGGNGGHSHPASPGNGGTPGNGGQNGHGHGHNP